MNPRCVTRTIITSRMTHHSLVCLSFLGSPRLGVLPLTVENISDSYEFFLKLRKVSRTVCSCNFIIASWAEGGICKSEVLCLGRQRSNLDRGSNLVLSMPSPVRKHIRAPFLQLSFGRKMNLEILRLTIPMVNS